MRRVTGTIKINDLHQKSHYFPYAMHNLSSVPELLEEKCFQAAHGPKIGGNLIVCISMSGIGNKQIVE